jgi:type II secretory pathway pseudopilin PulG
MRPRGTTLLETIVALGLTALVLSALGGAVLRAQEARERATAAADQAAALRTALMQIAADLEAARPPGLLLTPPPADRARAGSELSLPEVVRPRGDVHRVVYRLDPDPGGGWVLSRREWGGPGGCALDRPEPAGAALVGRVRSFRLRASDGEAWSDSWASGRLPRAVEVTIGVATDAGGTEEFATTVPLPAAERTR